MEKEKQRYSKWKFLLTFAVVMGLFAAVRHTFGIPVPKHIQTRALTASIRTPKTEEPPSQPTNKEDEPEENAWEEKQPDTTTFPLSIPEDTLLSSQEQQETEDQSIPSDTSNKEHRIRGVWSYSDCFPDIQDVQIVAAQQHGINPVSNRTEAEVLVKQHRLVNICHSPFYAIDPLTHSIPYLVPRAQHLLNTICLNFIDSCQVKGLPIHLPIVTSVLRTTDDVSRLQRGNKNATTNSCHCYGTTVDIAYNKFMPLTGTYTPRAALLRWNEPMKQVLSEVLNDLRKQGKCYVKYERKQGCFHLTCR